MKIIARIVLAVIIAISTFLTGCSSSADESLYRTRYAAWTQRLADNTAHYRDSIAIADAYQLQDELDEVQPPLRYRDAHTNLILATRYYTQALVEHKAGNDTKAVLLLDLCKAALQAAQHEMAGV